METRWHEADDSLGRREGGSAYAPAMLFFDDNDDSTARRTTVDNLVLNFPGVVGISSLDLPPSIDSPTTWAGEE